MYKTILVTLDGTPTDRAIIEHVKVAGQAGAQPRGAAPRGRRLGRAHLRPGRGQPGDHRGHGLLEKNSAPNFKPPGFRPKPNWPTAIRSRKSSNGSSKKAATWWP